MNKELTLGQKQRLFTLNVAKLILKAYEMGYELTFGEAYRTPEQAELYANAGMGIKNSLHTQRLAIDLNLFKDGIYQTDSISYKRIGEYWESLNKGFIWGGRFKDGNHFSFMHNGVK